MKKHLGQRILLSLLLSSCVTSYASAADGTYEYEYNTYTVSDGTGTVTYTDANGTTHTYTYSTKTADATTATQAIKTTYTSVVTEGGGTNIARIDATLYTANAEEEAVPITVYYGNSSGTISNSGNNYNFNNDDHNISGDFVGNSSGSDGGAIYNYASIQNDDTIGTISGNFIGNSSDGHGGAICNSASIGEITGDFIANYTIHDKGYSIGGVIYNYNGDIGTITANCIGNYALGELAIAGAVYNDSASIGEITGNFVANYAKSDVYAEGGAISNYSSGSDSRIGQQGGNGITGSFIQNFADG